MTEVSPRDREDVLRWATRITTLKTDPAAVIINAGPLLAWLEDATSKEDQRLRHAALARCYTNLATMRTDSAADDTDAFLRRQGLAPAAGDNPEEFLQNARVFYAFLTAGSKS